MLCFHPQEKKLRWNDKDESGLPLIVWMHVNYCDFFRFELINAVLHKTMIQCNVEVIAKTEVPRDVRNSKVQKQDKFRRRWSQHYTALANPKVGQDQVSGGVSVPCRHATPVADALWKPIFSNNVKLDNTTNTTSSSCMLSIKRRLLTWSTSTKCKVFHLCLAYLDKLPFSILNQACPFSCHILSLMA